MELLYYVLAATDSKKPQMLCTRIPLRKKSTISKTWPRAQKHLLHVLKFSTARHQHINLLPDQGFTLTKKTLVGMHIQEKVGTIKVTLKGPRRRVARQRKGDVAAGELCCGTERGKRWK